MWRRIEGGYKKERAGTDDGRRNLKENELFVDDKGGIQNTMKMKEKKEG